MKTIFVIEDHPLYRAAIEQSLVGAGFHVFSRDQIEKSLDEIRVKNVDLVLLDLQMPGVVGFEGITKLKEAAPGAKIAILSAHLSDELVSKAMMLGADAYLSKSLGGDQLKSEIDRIFAGEKVIPDGVKIQHPHQLETVNLEDAMNRISSLTPQQAVILNKLCDGKLNKQIAYDLEISETTVKAHITAILRKLGVVNRTQAVLVAQSLRVDAEGQPFFWSECLSGILTYSADFDDPLRCVDVILDKFGEEKIALFVVFFSHQFIGEGLSAALKELSKKAPTIGCSTAGEITGEGYQSGQMLVLGFPESDYFAKFSEIDFNDTDAFAQLPRRILELKQAVQAARPEWDQEFALLLSDGMARNEDMVVSSIGPAIGNIPLFGGSAGDGMEFKETMLFADGELLNHHSICAILRTRFPVRAFRFDHFEPSHVQMIVTHADPENRIVYEINAEPAAEEYARLIGQTVENLSSITFATNPVMVSVGGQHHVRSIQKIEDNHALRFFSAIDEGLVLTLAKARDILIDTQEKLDSLGSPDFVLAFDCIFRKLEVEQLQATRQMSNILKSKNVVGFNTYGEQFSMLHVNQTLTGIAIYQSDEKRPI